jgi:hypothetical protein
MCWGHDLRTTTLKGQSIQIEASGGGNDKKK